MSSAGLVGCLLGLTLVLDRTQRIYGGNRLKPAARSTAGLVIGGLFGEPLACSADTSPITFVYAPLRLLISEVPIGVLSIIREIDHQKVPPSPSLVLVFS